MRTDLYHNHAKSENVPFPRDFIASLKDLWCGPRSRISLRLCYKNRIYSANDCGEPKIRQTGMAIAINENVGLEQSC